MGYQWKGTHQGPDMFDATEEPPTPIRRATPAATELKPCGTEPAYRRHLKNGEEVCQPCRQAKVEYDRRMRAKGRVRGKAGNQRVAECGTYSGAQRHYALGEEPCPACREARNEYRRQHEASKRAA